MTFLPGARGVARGAGPGGLIGVGVGVRAAQYSNHVRRLLLRLDEEAARRRLPFLFGQTHQAVEAELRAQYAPVPHKPLTMRGTDRNALRFVAARHGCHRDVMLPTLP